MGWSHRTTVRPVPRERGAPRVGADNGRSAAVLRVFAQLTGAGDRVSYDVTAGGRRILWLGLSTALTERWQQISAIAELDLPRASVQSTSRLRASPDLERLASLDALHAHERLLREGWVYLVGATTVDGERRRVCLPLLSRPVRLSKVLGSFVVAATGDLELTPLVTDPSQTAAFERDAQFGGGALTSAERGNPRILERLPRLTSWIRAVAGAAGLPVAEVLPWTRKPATLRDRNDLGSGRRWRAASRARRQPPRSGRCAPHVVAGSGHRRHSVWTVIRARRRAGADRPTRRACRVAAAVDPCARSGRAPSTPRTRRGGVWCAGQRQEPHGRGDRRRRGGAGSQRAGGHAEPVRRRRDQRPAATPARAGSRALRFHRAAA